MNKKLIEDEHHDDYIIIRKESANAALKYLSECSETKKSLPFPDLIFLDIEMPTLNGWDFIQSFENIKASLIGTPVIYMLSSYAGMQEEFDISKAVSLSGVYEKPLTYEILNAILDKHFIPA